MARTNVGVLRGGASSEYDASLRSGTAILNALPEESYETRDIFIDKAGRWHSRGMPVEPARALSQLDVIMSGLHGGIGEDGTVQRILELSGVPYAGSRPLSAALSLNKIRARDIFLRNGIRVPQGVWFSREDGITPDRMAHAVFSLFGPPYVLKPPQEGAGHGIEIADSVNELPDAIVRALAAYGAVLVEEFIRGREATVGIIEGYRYEPLYALPPAEVVLPEGSRILEPMLHEFDLARYVVPSTFDASQKQQLADIARRAHRALGLSHFSRADLIVTPRAVYLLEVNAMPGLHEEAAFPAMLRSVGSSLQEFLEHSIRLARAA